MVALFTYASLTDRGTYLEVVGRHPETLPARLEGYRIARSLGYAYLVEDPDSHVEGFLVRNVQTPDLWILDDYHAVAEGLYERCRVQVRVGEQGREAEAYVAGPAMNPEETSSGPGENA
ncbi:MAG: gamma-glutamylcyclotransferase family protein [Candidatus Xenobium sp.]|nr:gamma-glutamylcyclotransferase [Burkholderiales bacterium]